MQYFAVVLRVGSHSISVTIQRPHLPLEPLEETQRDDRITAKFRESRWYEAKDGPKYSSIAKTDVRLAL